MPDRQYSDAELRDVMGWGMLELPPVRAEQIADTTTRALFETASADGKVLTVALRAIREVLDRPDVRPGSADEWGSNTRLRAKIRWEGGLFETLVGYGIGSNEIEDPVVAEAWEAGNQASAVYQQSVRAVRERLEQAA